MQSNPKIQVFTIGHSTHAIEEFIAILQAHEVKRLVDIRTVPRSRHNPQFNRDTLPASLHEAGIDYCYLVALGGLRPTHKSSINGGWRNDSFRGYADYMQTPAFAAGIAKLIALAQESQIAIMCAEAVPWRCHRSLIGDALLVRGVAVEDIMGATHRTPHKLTKFAVVEGLQITYPPYEEEEKPTSTKHPSQPK